MPPRTVPGVAVPGSTVPVDRMATRPWVTACQITGAAFIKSKRSQPVAIAPCFYPMTKAVIRAIDPITGEVFARTTARTYHAAIVATSPATGLVEVLAWCGRPELALSQLDKATRGTLDNWRGPRPDARLAIVDPVLGKAPAVKPARPRTLAQLTAHPWVESIDDARGSGDGLHVYLMPGYVWTETACTVIEPTVREACQAFRDVVWDPEGWAGITGASAAELAALTGEAVPSIADAALEASAALNAEGEAATSRALAGIGRIRAGLEALEALEVARPVLPGEATPPPAPSHGEAAPTLPDLYPATPGTPTRAEAVRDVDRRVGGGVAVICSDSPREAFRLPDTVSLCGAAAALEAGGWDLSPELEALARRWRDISGDQEPSAEAVAIAEAAAPRLKRFEVFHRTWWQAEGVPGVGESHHVGWANTEARARYMCRRWNTTHTPGPLSDRAEYTAA